MEGEDSSDEDIPLDQLVPNCVQDTQDGPEAPGPMNVGTVAAQGSNNDDDEIEIFRAAPEPTPAQTWARVRANMDLFKGMVIASFAQLRIGDLETRIVTRKYDRR
ncbi:hypothetical protein PCANC_26838 [Puccinia coronata f. sp. avenae]|uniref:Uncharacterized protein n=1 Tax=Puccinia coronata f. sp. avenae TaxID=200324 RepID=A0A2N5TIM4_9BASI|nr:hypothetical protein PCANC_26838 [Puccinia coronata f. sp. avenae]